MVMDKNHFLNLILEELLPHIQLFSQNPFDPIVVRNDADTWKIIGTGNYAAVFMHPLYPDRVVKVYGRNPEELNKEVDVYKRLGTHKAFSQLLCSGDNFLVLKMLEGYTIFDAIV